MAYWLLKTEPSCWSWGDQVKKGIEHWDGVRNYQASNNLKAMQIGDLAFFYHSVHEKQIVGIVKIVRTYYPDPTDMSGRFGMVDVETFKSINLPISLADIKSDPRLQDMALVRQSRLSVMPVSKEQWDIILEKGQTHV